MTPRPLREGLIRALTRTYAQVLSRTGRSTTPFVRWSRVTNRAHDFTWLGGVETRELLLHGRGPLQIRQTSSLFDAVQKMHATASLNPYEREVLYGYPYVIGRHEAETVRGPLLTMAIRIDVEGDGFLMPPTTWRTSTPYRSILWGISKAMSVPWRGSWRKLPSFR